MAADRFQINRIISTTSCRSPALFSLEYQPEQSVVIRGGELHVQRYVSFSATVSDADRATTSPLRHVSTDQRLVSGRAQQLAVLREEWQRSASGELRVALVFGQAGLGKTRLAAELIARCDQSSVALLSHSCSVRSMPPLGPWALAVGLPAGRLNGHRACQVCGRGLGYFPSLARGAGIAHDAVSCADALRYHLVESIPGLLATACTDRPIILVLDDVHRSDDAVWQMLLQLTRDCPNSRLLVLATARPADLASNRTALEVLHALEQHARVRRIALTPLSRPDIRELAAHTLRHDRVPTALVDWLTARTQGNPRFAVGLLEALVNGEADLQAAAFSGVPDRLTRWIRAELARFDPSALAVLELLAVAGDALDPDDLARITAAPTEQVAVVLELLSRAGAIVEQQRAGSLGYTMAQVLTRDVLYADIGAARRRLLHRQVAATLRACGQMEAAASHYLCAAQAGDGEAITALTELVGQARQQGLDALTWQTVSALRDALSTDDHRWNKVLDALVQRPNWGIVDRTEHYVAEIAAAQRMRQLLPRVHGLQRQAEYRLWLARLFAYGAGNINAGVRECSQALALCQQAGCGAAARSAALELAKIRGWAGDLRGEQIAAQQLLREAEQAADHRAIAEALAALGHTLGWQGQFSEAEKVLLRSIDMARAAANSSWMAQSLALLACLDACRGDLISARTRCAQAAASSPPNDPTIARCGELIELLAGDLIMAQAHARQAQRHGLPAGCRVPSRLASRAAMTAAERGDLTNARRHLEQITGLDSDRLASLNPLHWWAQAVVARAEGQLSIAATALQRAVDGYTAMGAHALKAFVLADLAEATVLAGDRQTATDVASAAADNARRTNAPIHHSLHLLVTAWALIDQHRHHAAAQTAQQAIDEFSAHGYALLAARAHLAYAQAIQRSDRDAAAHALHNAVIAFDACGATRRSHETRCRLQQLQAARRCTSSPEPRPGPLTRRERQVAALAAGGYTATQIATQLHIGVRTVETHLAHTYPKLGITGKQQLVRRAAELGFAPDP